MLTSNFFRANMALELGDDLTLHHPEGSRSLALSSMSVRQKA